VSKATLGESGTPYEPDVIIDFDDTYVYNDIQITQSGSSPTYVFQTEDVASQNTYGVRSLTQTIEAANQTDCQGMGATLLARYKDAHARFYQVTLDGLPDATRFLQILGREIGDLVTMTRKPWGAPQISVNVFIDGIEHQITPTSWRCVFSTTPQYVATTY
jgi:hypothetical protein